MAMTEKQIEGVISLFALYYANEMDAEKRKGAYVQFEDNFGKSIGNWTARASEKIEKHTDDKSIVEEFYKFSKKEKEDLSVDFEIRKLCREDFEQVRELIRSEFGIPLTQYDESGLQKFLKSEHSFVVCRENEIFGVILAGEMPNVSRKCIYIDTFVVASTMRGRGIGHKLYKALIDVPMESHNAIELVLKTEKDRMAYQIYKHWGFTECELTYLSTYYISHAIRKEENAIRVKTRTERIKYILDNYHPILLPGEESMTFEEAYRLIEGMIACGETEEKAFDVLKYCTVGADFVEE